MLAVSRDPRREGHRCWRRTGDVGESGAAGGMGTVGRAVGLNNPSVRMTVEYWGKAKVVKAQLANRVSPLERNILQGNMDAKEMPFVVNFVLILVA